jgi:hypothetical protein
MASIMMTQALEQEEKRSYFEIAFSCGTWRNINAHTAHGKVALKKIIADFRWNSLSPITS